MVKLKIKGNEQEASITGATNDKLWDGRESKSITLAMDYATAMETFADDVPWSILYQPSNYYDTETKKMVTPPVEESDNSDYCILGDITVHRDGTVTVKMGKPTGEELYNILREAVEGEQEAAN